MTDSRRQCWLFEVQGPVGGHLLVTVRCGVEGHDRPLLGHLTMSPREWRVLEVMLKRGRPVSDAPYGHIEVEILDRRDHATADF